MSELPSLVEVGQSQANPGLAPENFDLSLSNVSVKFSVYIVIPSVLSLTNPSNYTNHCDK